MKVRGSLIKVFEYAFLIIMFIAAVFPFFWMVTGTTNSAVDIVKGRIAFGDQLYNNIKTLFAEYNIAKVFSNSCKVSVLTVVGQLIISSMAGYGFELYSSRAGEKVYGAVLVTMMVPFAALMIPLFKLLVTLGFLDTHAGLIVTSLPSVFLIFFFRQSFKSFPKEIIHAARVDGAGEFQIFYSIIVPSMKATYAAAAIYSFMTSWNAYMWPLIVLQSNRKAIMQLLISTMSSAYFPEYGVIMVAILISMLPMIIIFFGLQNYFVEGITGSLKQ